MTEVRLNGKTYVVRGRIRRDAPPQFANAFRPEGRVTLESVTNRVPYVFGTPSGGFGLNRIRDVRDAGAFLRVWDSTMETRWGQVTLPLLEQNATEPATTGVTYGAMKVGIEHAGTLYGAKSSNDGEASPYNLVSFAYGSGSWDHSETDVQSAANFNAPVAVFDACVHKGRRFFLFAVTNDHHLMSADGGVTDTYDDATAGTGWPDNLAGTITQDENSDLGLLLDNGDTLLVALAEATIHIYKSSDADTYSGGASPAWTSVVSIKSGGGPTGFCLYYDQSGSVVPMLGTREGVYAIDVANGIATLLINLTNQPNDNNCRRMCVWQGSMYVPTGDGGLLRYTWDGSTGRLEDVGLNSDDGLPSERQGYVTWMVPTTRWLFMSYGGDGESAKAGIYAMDIHGAWHHIYQHGTANRKIDWFTISNAGGGTVTMHIAVRTGTNSTDMLYLEKPLTNPASDSTVKKAASGSITRPAFDFGFPGDSKAVLSLRYNAADLSADNTGEYIAVEYDAGETGTFTSLGNIVSGDTDLDFGSGAGVSGKIVRIKETYHRDSGTNTDTPTGYDFELSALVHPTVKRTYAFDVDLLGSSDPNMRPEETVIADLEDAEASVTLVDFSYGRLSTKKVTVDGIRWDEALADGNEIAYEPREGFAVVTVREV